MAPAPRLDIRAAGPHDRSTVASLLEASYPTLMRGHYPDAVLNLALPYLVSPSDSLLADGTYFIASDSGEPLGCGGWSMGRPGTGEREPGLAHIRHFAVHPDAVGTGIGSALFDRCVFDARTAGADRLEVYSSLNAEGFYARMGCRPIKQVTLNISGVAPVASILMERAL